MKIKKNICYADFFVVPTPGTPPLNPSMDCTKTHFIFLKNFLVIIVRMCTFVYDVIECWY